MGVKKLLCLGLTAAVFCSFFHAVPSQAQGTEAERQEVTLAADSQADGFEIKNGVLVGYTGEGGDVVVPEGVTGIGWGAFYDCSSLSSVTIPEGVDRIEDYAFHGCSRLSSVSIPKGVTHIGLSAFKGCSSLGRVTIPGSVSSIERYVFSGCSSLSNVTIPEGVSSIGDGAFERCSSLSSVSIPDSVSSIGGYAFSGCSSLSSVSIPEGVSSIGDGAFERCSSLSSINVAAGNTTYDSRGGCNAIIETGSNTLISGCKNTIIPSSATGIGNYAFRGCSSLRSVTIPEGMSSIGRGAFEGCSSLNNIAIPEGVIHIEDYVFSGCSSLISIKVAAENKTYDSREDCNAIIKTGSNTLISGCKNTIIPNSVTSIDYGAFQDCISLSSITIPESVTSIGDSAFYKCSSLNSISLPDSLTSIGRSAFEGCSSLSSVTIPESVTNIGEYAFYECSSLRSVSIVEGVAGIGDSAFERCSSLSSVTIPEGVTSIGYYVFLGCSSIKNITIPRTVTYIGGYALGYDWRGDERKKIDDFQVIGYSGSEAQAYARKNGFPFVDIENPIVNKAEQKFTGTKTYKKTYGDRSFTLDARLTKGDGKISYSSSNPQVVSISQKGKATLRSAGISAITITAGETKDYSEKTFKVKIEVSPKKPVLNKPQTKTGRKLAISWKRDANVTGYEVWCSTDKNFRKDCKKAVIRNNKTVSHKFTGLKAGKKYYVRVCSYKTVKINGKSQTLNSKWNVKQSKKIQK